LSPHQNLNTELLYDPLLLDIYPKEPKVFTAAIFLPTKRQKKPKCLSTDEGKNKI
jgi:hypothetical protein